MLPHPSTLHAVAELRRRDLLVDARRQYLADLAPAVRPRTPLFETLWQSTVAAMAGTWRHAGRSPQIGIYADAPRPATT